MKCVKMTQRKVKNHYYKSWNKNQLLHVIFVHIYTIIMAALCV